MQTDFQDKASILAHLWVWYRTEQALETFVEFNDLGLPLAYMLSENLATVTESGARFVEDTFDMLLQELNLEDTGFNTLDEVFSAASFLQ
jgi:hypothetical protein